MMQASEVIETHGISTRTATHAATPPRMKLSVVDSGRGCLLVVSALIVAAVRVVEGEGALEAARGFVKVYGSVEARPFPMSALSSSVPIAPTQFLTMFIRLET